ncbi:PREDICTED: uncharacterized protein LOC105960832 [Erythranthe guttata]|uniref:uncharacterized protein LOC105960832 n=1 Tax=Erythranthe guttata TaxID=4155 RepID=UPI00064DC74D|nr:PREDICTED: uncharacterized protein LOC105960832 [Erythranthe guttata]|eukprot:XP_012840498.1 PREDICTED: uncharacterized protein LOC105960832 [Erythranthe guttata]
MKLGFMIDRSHISNLYIWMQLLGWMHRKLKHNGCIEALNNNSTIGNGSTCFSVQTVFDEHKYYIEPAKPLPHSNMIHRKSSNGYEGGVVEASYKEELFEPFDFLSIGTFGYEFITDTPTPTLAVSIEKLTGQQQIEMITENDVNVMKNELDKFIEAEEAVSSQRTSQASIITLSYKPIFEGEDSIDGHMHMVATCPLQNYLFAASVELLAETENQELKRERTSLEELFKRNSVYHENPPTKKCTHELGSQKQAKKGNIIGFMKKVANKFHCSSSNCVSAPDKDTTTATTASNPIKKKLSKVRFTLSLSL